MSGKKQHHEEHVDESWLIPYADVLTLLLALFIVMFATSKADPVKRKELSTEFSTLFEGGQISDLDGGKGILDNNGKTILPFKPANKVVGENSEHTSDADGKKTEEEKLKEIKELLDEAIGNGTSGGNKYSDNIHVKLSGKYLEISIQDVVLFNSGHSEILSNIHPLLKTITDILGDLNHKIIIGGHTDDIPISTPKYNSNWELSADRAINVMEFMSKETGIPEKRFSIEANGEFQPIADNKTIEGRAKNRRVEIFVVRENIEGETKEDDKKVVEDLNNSEETKTHEENTPENDEAGDAKTNEDNTHEDNTHDNKAPDSDTNKGH